MVMGSVQQNIHSIRLRSLKPKSAKAPAQELNSSQDSLERASLNKNWLAKIANLGAASVHGFSSKNESEEIAVEMLKSLEAQIRFQ